MVELVTCPHWERLTNEYRDCVDRFRDSVALLRELHGAAYDRGYRNSERLRIAAEQARDALELHRSQHMC